MFCNRLRELESNPRPPGSAPGVTTNSNYLAVVIDQDSSCRLRFAQLLSRRANSGSTDRLERTKVEGEGFGHPRDIFSKITAPTLILKADAEEEYRKRHLEAAELLPNGKLIHIDGASHLIRHDKPDGMEKEVRAFLSSVSL